MNDLEVVLVAPIITDITFVFKFNLLLIFIMETQFTYCAVETEILYRSAHCADDDDDNDHSLTG
jgi:hypothetical protein